MGFLSQLFNGGLAKLFTSVMDEIHLSPEKKAEYNLALAQMQAQAAQADKDLEGKLNDIAGQNIRADSSSSDWFVRRARPLFIWIVSIAIGVDLLIFPLVNAAFGRGLTPIVIPDQIMSIFKVAMLGYTAARSVEKLANRD